MGVRARIIDRLTDAVRAPREVARLRAECERLRAALSEVPAGLCCMSCDRDDRRHGARSVVVANPACDACMLRWAESELVRVRAERDARIPTDIDGAQAWAERRGVVFRAGREWESLSADLGGGGYAGPSRAAVVSATVGERLRVEWSGQIGGDA
jgi:hypothetical protein